MKFLTNDLPHGKRFRRPRKSIDSRGRSRLTAAMFSRDGTCHAVHAPLTPATRRRSTRTRQGLHL